MPESYRDRCREHEFIIASKLRDGRKLSPSEIEYLRLHAGAIREMEDTSAA